MDSTPSHLTRRIPSVPRLIYLRIYLAISVCLTAVAFSFPIRLSLAFKGTISANGPTTPLESITDGTISQLPDEGVIIPSDHILFTFQQPVITADLDVLRVQERDFQQRLNQSEHQCKVLIDTSLRAIANAKRTYSLYERAYQQQAISQVALLSHRDAIDQADQQLEQQRGQCLRDNNSLKSQLTVTREQINKQISAVRFQQELRAPVKGSVHGLTVKAGQRVFKGQVLGQFTAVGSTGARLSLPAQDRPFVSIGQSFNIYSPAYAFLVKQPERRCTIDSITPDVVASSSPSLPPVAPSYIANCHFQALPLDGAYPLLVGMDVDAYGTSTYASLFQLILQGYRRLVLSSDSQSANASR